jgi:hypothetical protein
MVAAPVSAAEYKAPRTAFGQPNLEGVWNTHFILPIEARPEVLSLTLPEAEASVLAHTIARETDSLAILALDPEIGEMHKTMAEQGLAIVRGERRTRQVVQPADGKLPYTSAARREVDYIENLIATEIDPPQRADHPEQRPSWERCLALQGQPPIIAVTDANPRRIIQTRDHVLIHTEYGDEVRIVPFTDKHRAAVHRSVLGDSIARWEGDTLVIETVRLPARDRMRVLPTLIVPAEATVIEKYTRLSKDELLYQYTIIDPEVYTALWLAEYSLYRTDARMFEFACHEGNYSLPGILQGAREKERKEGL